jgi:CHAD domain-containing protein
MQPLEFALSVHRSLEARVARLDELTAAPRWWEDAAGLHDARVAARRLRAVLELLDPEVYPRLKAARRALRAVTALTGPRRELDVHRELLDGLRAQAASDLQRATAEHLMQALDRGRAKAARELAKAWGAVKPAAWRRLLGVASLPRPFQGEAAPDAAWSGILVRLEPALAALAGLVGAEDAVALHEARVALKRARYRVEILGALFPAAPAAFLARLKTLQDALGRHHDATLLEALLRERQAELAAGGFTVLAASTLELAGLAAEARVAAFRGLGALLEGLDPVAGQAALQAELRGGPA